MPKFNEFRINYELLSRVLEAKQLSVQSGGHILMRPLYPFHFPADSEAKKHFEQFKDSIEKMSPEEIFNYGVHYARVSALISSRKPQTKDENAA